MEARARYLLVGSTVLLVAVLLAGAVLWLAEAGSRTEKSWYTIFFEHHSLAGLQDDSAVTMKGIRVGSVDHLEIPADNIEQVKVVIMLAAGTPVKMDTEAVIQRNLLTGLANIDLIHSTQQSPLRTDIPAGEIYPVIPEGQPELAEMFATTLPALLDKINVMVENASALFTPENRNLVQRMLLDISAATEKLGTSQEQLQVLLEKAARLTDESRQLLGRLDERSAVVGASLTAAIGDIRGQVEAVGRLAAELEHQAVRFGDNSTELNRSISAAAGSIAGEVEFLAGELAATARQLNTTLAGYEQPRQILWGPGRGAPGPGEPGGPGQEEKR
ncbi:MAG: MCE family protein [Deltaproteobacteria bacterium]|nr:MCE family protein [Candidatus Anaeroferrophillacea bacterium]